MGLTATCTSDVSRDVKKMLHIPEAITFKATFNRPNLFYSVRRKPPTLEACIEELVQLIGTTYRGQSGIVYTTTIKDTEELAERLCKAGIKAAPYHARLEAPHRSRIHEHWQADKLRVVVATIAFGMGIDKPDVRFVHPPFAVQVAGELLPRKRPCGAGRPAGGLSDPLPTAGCVLAQHDGVHGRCYRPGEPLHDGGLLSVGQSLSQETDR